MGSAPAPPVPLHPPLHPQPQRLEQCQAHGWSSVKSAAGSDAPRPTPTPSPHSELSPDTWECPPGPCTKGLASLALWCVNRALTSARRTGQKGTCSAERLPPTTHQAARRGPQAQSASGRRTPMTDDPPAAPSRPRQATHLHPQTRPRCRGARGSLPGPRPRMADQRSAGQGCAKLPAP